MIKKENKKVTIKKLFKKMTLTALLSATLASSAALAPTPAAHAASSYSASKYFPGTGPHADAAHGIEADDPYPTTKDEIENATYFRNFKNKSANIYVKDKKILPVMKKAAKAWAPVFKFKFVKSGKHANFNSSKYANIVAMDGYNSDYFGVNRLLKNPKAAYTTKVKLPGSSKGKITASKYTLYAIGHVTNWKLRKAALEKGQMYADGTSAGYWKPSNKDARTNSWTRHFNLVIDTKDWSQAEQVGHATQYLGYAIGLYNGFGEDDNIMNQISGTKEANFSTTHVTQTDYEYVKWIYAHPWSGTNSEWENRTVLS